MAIKLVSTSGNAWTSTDAITWVGARVPVTQTFIEIYGAPLCVVFAENYGDKPLPTKRFVEYYFDKDLSVKTFNEKYDDQIVTTKMLNLPYGTSYPLNSILEEYGDAPLTIKQIQEKYSDAGLVVTMKNLPYAMSTDITKAIEEIYGIAGVSVVGIIEEPYNLELLNAIKKRYKLPYHIIESSVSTGSLVIQITVPEQP
jgi:hypothetical protein